MCEPLGECQTHPRCITDGVGRSHWVSRRWLREDAQKTCGHLGAGKIDVAAVEQANRRGGADVPESLDLLQSQRFQGGPVVSDLTVQ